MLFSLPTHQDGQTNNNEDVTEKEQSAVTIEY